MAKWQKLRDDHQRAQEHANRVLDSTRSMPRLHGVRDIDDLAPLGLETEGQFLEIRESLSKTVLILFFHVKDEESTPAGSEEFSADGP